MEASQSCAGSSGAVAKREQLILVKMDLSERRALLPTPPPPLFFLRPKRQSDALKMRLVHYL